MASEEISICREWVSIEDYQFKILVLTSVLAENNLAYRGTLQNMCDWLGIVNAPKNTKRIKEAIEELQKNEYIFYHKEGQTHHISITNKGLKDKRIVKLKKEYINAIKQFNIARNGKVNRSWETMLKCLIVLLNKAEELKSATFTTTMKDISAEIGKCEATTRNTLDKLTKCKFEDMQIKKEIQKAKMVTFEGKEETRTIGTSIVIGIKWGE